MELKEIQGEIQKVWGEMKSVLDAQAAEIKKFGETSGETKGVLTKLEQRMDELETKLNRPGAAGEGAKGDDGATEKKSAFDLFCRKGIDKMNPEQVKLMTISDDTTGGYLAMPETLAGELIADIVEFDPIRTVARVRQTSSRSVKIRKKTGRPTGGAWVGEVGSRTDLGNMTFGMIEVPVHEIAGYVDISNQDLNDVDFNLEGELRMELSEQFGVTEGSAFISGNGVNKPQGLLDTSAGLSETTGGHASEITADALINIFYDLKPQYAANGVWLLNRNSLKAIRKLKDSNNNYIWTPNLGIGKPPTILERPYIECPNMPDIGSNTYPVIFGDLKKGYIIIDRTVIEMLRDPFTQAGTGTTRFYAYKRVGGQVVQAEAIRKLKIAAS